MLLILLLFFAEYYVIVCRVEHVPSIGIARISMDTGTEPDAIRTQGACDRYVTLHSVAWCICAGRVNA